MFKNPKEEYEEQQSVFKKMSEDPSFKKIDLSLFHLEDFPNFKPPTPVTEKTFYSASDLLSLDIKEIPKLLDPILQKVGLASIVGTSDVGKSTLLRQLSLHIALQLNEFLGFKLDGKTNKVIYVNTEDDIHTVSYGLKIQVKQLMEKYPNVDTALLSNLFFLFEPDDLLGKIENMIKKNPVDLIIIDAFTDVFTKEINSNTQVREFLNSFDKLAKKHKCLVVFLHHIGKNKQYSNPSKDSIIGSQGFEAKMRSVLELRSHKGDSNLRDLWVLKSNFLSSQTKGKGFTLSFGNQIFKNTGENVLKSSSVKSKDPKLIEKVKELHERKYSTRKIEDALKNTEYKVSKSVIHQIIKNLK